MANWTNPVLTSAYTDFLTGLKDRDYDCATMFAAGTETNIPTGAMRYSKASNLFESYSAGWSTEVLSVAGGGTGATDAAGARTSLGALSTTGTAAAATKLASARTIGGTGFDGTEDITPANCTTSASCSGNAATATWADTVDVNVGTSATYYDVVIAVGDTLYDVAKTEIQASTGNFRTTGDITAYYSDERLKDIIGKIPNALDKVMSLEGFQYKENELAKSFGYDSDEVQIGVSAQKLKAVLPEAVKPAPFDMSPEAKSISGEDYLTVDYAKITPLLIEAVKDLKAEIDELKKPWWKKLIGGK